MSRATLAVVVLLLSGCGGASPRADAPATLDVEQRFEGDILYIEGAVSYVRLEGVTTTEERLEDGRAQLRLAAGSYVLHSWQRPCDANCGFLDPPTDRCSQPFEARAGERLKASIVVQPGEGCSIEVQ